MVEAIQSLFEPVVVYNNKSGVDAANLKRFKEPSWNYQVVRFLDSNAKDIIPRRDRVWTTPALAARMITTLQKKNQKVPLYLRALAGKSASTNVGKAAFAMHCFWTGELRLGGLPGVITTEAGWFDGREVTLVEFDRSQIAFNTLVEKAVSFDCARSVYTTTDADAKVVKKTRLANGLLTASYRPAAAHDQKRQLTGTKLTKLTLSPMQATKINALVRTDTSNALSWLSPQQLNSIR